MVIDSNIIIAYLGGDKDIISLLTTWKRDGFSLFLPTIVESEVLSFSKLTPNEMRITERFIEETFTSIPFERYIARVTAEIRRNVNIKFPDAAIAATGIFTKTPVVTRNRKDFQRVPTLRIIVP